MGNEHDFKLSAKDWESAVFDAATHYLVSLSKGSGKRESKRFERGQLPKALKHAETWKGPYGRRPTVSAVAGTGRAIVLDRKDWPKWTQRWQETASRACVSYLRVSTDRQGRSGLGLEAQRKAVADHLHAHGLRLVHEYVEVESGKKNDRPELMKALDHAASIKGKLVIAKLDRLARNVAFIANLMESGVEFVAADMPMANRLTVHILAAVAEHEREMISKRTKEALAAAKARGVKLGNPRGAKAFRGRGKGSAVAALKRLADQHAHNVAPFIAAIQAEGHRTLAAIADELNRRGVKTAREGKWHAATVRNVRRRVIS